MRNMSQKPRQPRPPRPARRSHHKRSAGWVPDQHGAWFMVTIPPLTALALTPTWTGLAVTATWLLGYFAFFAVSVWLRSRRQRRHLAPAATYTALTAVAGCITLLADVSLLTWVALIAPLAAIAIWETYRRRPRSLLSGVSTVLAASLMVPIIAGPTPKAWAIAAIYAGYFVGTVPYVKTMIRKRGNRQWLIGSVTYHVLITAVAIIGWLVLHDRNLISIGVPIVAIGLLIRSFTMPISGARRARPWTPKQVGILDAFFGVAVVLAAW
ncbi:hypothetical protein EGX79_08675 [Corynebacterium jeikeium]|nr:hypothetical protein EGX79_08675 [Corynebacterium jeikeium]